jgi:hypothetical protein
MHRGNEVAIGRIAPLDGRADRTRSKWRTDFICPRMLAPPWTKCLRSRRRHVEYVVVTHADCEQGPMPAEPVPQPSQRNKTSCCDVHVGAGARTESEADAPRVSGWSRLRAPLAAVSCRWTSSRSVSFTQATTVEDGKTLTTRRPAAIRSQ